MNRHKLDNYVQRLYLAAISQLGEDLESLALVGDAQFQASTVRVRVNRGDVKSLRALDIIEMQAELHAELLETWSFGRSLSGAPVAHLKIEPPRDVYIMMTIVTQSVPLPSLKLVR